MGYTLRSMLLHELDPIIALHLEGLDRELNLLNQIMGDKSVDYSGKKDLKKVLYQMIISEECKIFVALKDKTFVGYCLCTKKIYPVENPKICGCINGIYIKDEARRQNLGTQLFNMAVDWLKNEGITYLELYHMLNDKRAAAFWQKMGFVNVQYNCAKKL